MKVYYYCMAERRKEMCARIQHLCEHKFYDERLTNLYIENIEMFRNVECRLNPCVKDIFYADNKILALQKDGTAIDFNGELVFNNIDNVFHRVAERVTDFKALDGKIYRDLSQPKEINADSINMPYILEKTERGYKLLSPYLLPYGTSADLRGLPYVASLERLKSLDVNFEYRDPCMKTEADNLRFVEINSSKILYAKGITFFEWNGLLYKMKIGVMSNVVNVAYCDNYPPISEIKAMITDKIYINYEGKVVFMPEWRKSVDEACIKAERWEKVDKCYSIRYGRTYHLMAITQEGQLLNTFDSDFGKGLEDVENVFWAENFGIITTG